MDRRLMIFLVFALNFISSTPFAQTQPLFEIHRPTVVAFYVPLPPGSRQEEENEALSDFQFYLQQSRTDLNALGIDLRVVYAPSFQTRMMAETRIFRTDKARVGYYFIAPGRKPHVEYGVLTNGDLLQIAREYLEKTPKLQGAVR